MNGKYDVVFNGSISDGVSIDQVKKIFSTVLNLSDKQIDLLFSSPTITVMSAVDRDTALKFQKTFEKVGVFCNVRKIALDFSLDAIEFRDEDEPVKKTTVSEKRCPECGKKQLHDGLCASCRNTLRAFHIESGHIEKFAREFGKLEGSAAQPSVLEIILGWIRSNVLKASALIIFVLLSSSMLIFSAILSTHDQHLVYQTPGPTKICGNIPKLGKRMTKEQGQLLVQFEDDFSSQERKKLLKRWNNIACRAMFSMELGNVGSQTIALAALDFNTSRFFQGEIPQPVFIQTQVEDISAESPRESNPQIQHNGGLLRIANLQPGTRVRINFSGWLDGNRKSIQWREMLTRIDIGKGRLETGNVSSNAFTRFLTKLLPF